MLIALLVLPNVVFILRNHAVWPWDQSGYGSEALLLWDVRSAGAGPWLQTMKSAVGAKPPLLVWTSQFFVPFRRITPDVEASLLLVNVLAALAILALVYRASRLLGAGVTASLAGVALCGGASLFIALTPEFLVETVQSLPVAVMVFVAAGAAEHSWFRTFSWSLLAIAVGVLAKAPTIVFLLPFLLVIAFVAVKTARQQRRSSSIADWLVAAAALVFLAGAWSWYATNWGLMTQHFQNATANKMALLWGTPGRIGKLGMWLGKLTYAISPFPAVTAAIFIVIVVALILAIRLKYRGLLFACVAAAVVVISLVGYSLQIAEDTRFLAPLLPILGVLLSWSLAVIGRPRVAAVVLAVLMVNATIGYAVALGGLQLDRKEPWLKPVQRNTADAARVRQAIDATCRRANAADRPIMVAMELPPFNPVSANFYAIKERGLRGFRCVYGSLLDPMETDIRLPLSRLANTDYFITLGHPQFVNDRQRAFNRFAQPIAQQLDADPQWARIPGLQHDLVIFQRREIATRP